MYCGAVYLASAIRGRQDARSGASLRPSNTRNFPFPFASRLGMLSEFVDPDELISLVDPSKQNNANDIKTMLEGAFGNKNARPEVGHNASTLRYAAMCR